MRIGSLHIGRAAEPIVTPKKELGASGVVNLSGFLQELEYSSDLIGERGVDTFERMRSSDGAVSEALGHFVNPVRNATWDVEPYSEDPQDLEIAEAVRRAFFVWSQQPFSEYVDQAMDYLVFGRGVFEIGWHVVEDELQVEQPEADPVVVASRQFLTFRRFAQRLPKTITRWIVEDGDLQGVEQQVWKDGSYVTVTIPAEQLVVFVNQRRGDDFTGRSLLRGAHKHWVMKELVEKIEVVSMERLGVGILVGYPSQSQNDDATLDRMESILRDIRAGARTYIVAPGPKGQSSVAGQDGFVFEILTPSGASPDFKGAKEYHRGEIKGSMLVRFSDLGHGQTGARATSDSQSEIWYDALHSVAKYFAEVNDDPIRQMVDANYPAANGYPKLVARDIESKSLLEFADANAKLVSSGAIEPDRGYRAYVREGIGAPDEDDPEASDQQADDAADDDGPGFQADPDQPDPPAPPDPPVTTSVAAEPSTQVVIMPADNDADREENRLVRAKLLELASREPVAPIVNVETAPVVVNAAEQLAPNVIVHPPQVTVQAPNVTVESPSVQVDSPVTVHVPEQPPPNVTIENTLEAPNKRVQFKRDSKGNIIQATTEDTQ